MDCITYLSQMRLQQKDKKIGLELFQADFWCKIDNILHYVLKLQSIYDIITMQYKNLVWRLLLWIFLR